MPIVKWKVEKKAGEYKYRCWVSAQFTAEEKELNPGTYNTILPWNNPAEGGVKIPGEFSGEWNIVTTNMRLAKRAVRGWAYYMKEVMVGLVESARMLSAVEEQGEFTGEIQTSHEVGVERGRQIAQEIGETK